MEEESNIVDPLHEETQKNSEEHLARNPPPSLVPRLHALIISKLEHTNPCLVRDAFNSPGWFVTSLRCCFSLNCLDFAIYSFHF